MSYAEGTGVVVSADANSITIKYERTDEDELVSFDDDLKTVTTLPSSKRPTKVLPLILDLSSRKVIRLKRVRCLVKDMERIKVN